MGEKKKKSDIMSKGEKEFNEYLQTIAHDEETDTKDDEGWKEVQVMLPKTDNGNDPIITVWYIYRNEPGERGKLYAVTNDENKILLFVRERNMKYFFIQRFRMLESEFEREFKMKNKITLMRTTMSVTKNERVSIFHPTASKKGYYDVEVELPRKTAHKLRNKNSQEDLIKTHRFNKRYLHGKYVGFKRAGLIRFDIDTYNDTIEKEDIGDDGKEEKPRSLVSN